MKKLYKITVLLIAMIAMAAPSFAQRIGGNMTPLLYSVHTYSISMGDVTYQPNWGLYPAGTAASEIEDGTAVALIPGTDFTVIELPFTERIVSGRSYWKIQFNNNIAVSTPYVIGYKENTVDINECLTAVVQDIEVQGIFDVDVALETPDDDAARCGDESNQLLIDTETIQTQVNYRVFINYPENPPGYVESGGTGYWRFDFNITATGRGGAAAADATIASITATDGATNIGTWNPSPGTSSFDANIDVNPVSISPVYFTVTYNEVLGVTQDISFSISTIRGAYLEPDIDEISNRPDLNRVTHTIYAMPNVGQITAWN